MKFIDTTTITVQAGDGGSGLISFKSAANKPKLGPDGGDGGFGGSVFAVGKRALHTLGHLRFKKCHQAQPGKKGGTSHKRGADGKHLEIPMPLGTIVHDAKSGNVIGEILHPGQRLLLAHGGKRGLGNMRFVSSTQRAPYKSTAGGKGEHKTLKLELKLVADVGFAGLPNAGKSTLLSAISYARPKIGDYPFTTLNPFLGVVEVENDLKVMESFVAADIPGLIKGASSGKGLGIKFLRHLERCRLIAYVLDGFAADEQTQSVEETFLQLREEMQSYSAELVQKKAVAIVNKLDLASGADKRAAIKAFFTEQNIPLYFISAKQGIGLDVLKRSLLEMVRTETTDLTEEERQHQEDDFYRFRSRREEFELQTPPPRL